MNDREIIERTRRLAREDIEDPITVGHPVLGEFLLRRQWNYYSREIDWCGRAATVSFDVVSPAAMQTRLEQIATFFVEAEQWRARIAAQLVKDLPEMAESWGMTPPAPHEGMWKRVTQISLGFAPGGRFDAHFEYETWIEPWWVSVRGSLDGGVEDAMVEA